MTPAPTITTLRISTMHHSKINLLKKEGYILHAFRGVQQIFHGTCSIERVSLTLVSRLQQPF